MKPWKIFGDRPPFTSCIDELDRTFNWAEHYGMKILVDLHTVPLSANGGDAWDKGSGSFYWSYKLLLDTVNDPNWYGWDSWDFGKSMDQGWLPENAYK